MAIVVVLTAVVTLLNSINLMEFEKNNIQPVYEITTKTKNLTNGYIQEVYTFNKTETTSREHIDKKKIPSCFNVTFEAGEFIYYDDSQSLLINVSMVNPETFHEFNLSDDKTSVSVCYPLSPQLQTCSKKTYSIYRSALPVTFRTTNHTIHMEGSDLYARLGDYFFGADNTVVLCAQEIWQNVIGIPRCNYVNLTEQETKALDRNGSFIIRTSSSHAIVDTRNASHARNKYYPRPANFCIPLAIPLVNCHQIEQLFPTEYTVAKNHSLYLMDEQLYVDVQDYFLSAENGMANVCAATKYWSSLHTVANNFYIGCYALSAFCLLLTALYQFFGQGHLTFHARSLLHHVLILIPANLGYAINNWVPIPPLDLSAHECYALFVVTYISYMWAFFWLHALAFDVFYTFFDLPTAKYKCPITLTDLQRFVIYNIYAWLVPLALCIGMLVDDQNRSARSSTWIFPEVTDYCWFHERQSERVFYYIPLGIIMCSNTLFFVCTVATIKFSSKGTELASNSHNMQRLIICLKLFVVMGLAWILEVIIWSVGDIGGYHLWYVSEAFTSLQGVAIFLVYICKQENYNKLRNSSVVNTLLTRSGLDINSLNISKT